MRVAPALGLGLALLLAACGTPVGTPTPAPATTAAPATAPTVAPTSPTASTEPVASPSAVPTDTAAPSSSASTGITREDPSLINVLPAEVAGIPVILSPEAFTEAITDPDFASNIESAAYGVVPGPNVTAAIVAHPVPGVFSDAWFRDWRDSYNAGACARAGGIIRTAETEVNGRLIYIGTCNEDMRTYHVWIPERELLVSAFSIGGGDLGVQLIEGLRP